MYLLAGMILLALQPPGTHPQFASLAWVNVIFAAGSLLVRIVATLGFERLHSYSPAAWQWLVVLTMLINLMTLGLVVGYIQYHAPGSFEGMVSALVSAGISIGVFTVFAPMLNVCTICLTMLLLPHIYGLSRSSNLADQGPLLMAVAIFAVYLAVLTYNRYREVWERIRHELELEASNLELETLARELQITNERALAASAAKTEFIANTSHELRTPLHSILGNAELIVTGANPDKQIQYANAIQRAGGSLLLLLNDLIDLSRIEAGALKIETGAAGLRALVQNIEEEMMSSAQQKGLKLECLLDGDAPDWVSVDAARLRQVIANLVSNAIKYTDTGRVRLFVSYDAPGESLEVFVSDTGPGVPMNQREMIFDAFVQLEGSASRQRQGVGLGLAICKRLVEVMGGKIGVDSADSVGSTFWFLVPATIVDSPYQGIVGSRRVEGQRRPREASVLVVDDNASNREMVGEQIKLLGFQCSTLDSGQAAIDCLGSAEGNKERF